MVYRGFDVGSAKPSMDERLGIPHHLIDVGSPIDITFNGYDFCQQAVNLIQVIDQEKQVPIVVGGTMMYAHLLQNIYHKGMPANNPDLRQSLNEGCYTRGKTLIV